MARRLVHPLPDTAMTSRSKSDQIDLILGALARSASERGTRLTKTRLVKFLYLLDLFWAQSEKKSFTGWPWAFVHYGPYCRESTDAVDRAERLGYLVGYSYESKFKDEDYRLYGPGERVGEVEVDEIKNALPLYVSSNLFDAVRKWGDDTYGLLDHLYFHTGPMADARPGERLSFDGEQKTDYRQFQPVKMVPLSPNSRAALLEAIQRMKAEWQVQAEPSSLYDKEYFDFVSGIAGEETPLGVSGVAKLKFPRNSDD